MKYLAFDLEIAKILPGDGIINWRTQRPLGITCAATCDNEGNTRVWYGGQAEGSYAPEMSASESRALLDYLWACQIGKLTGGVIGDTCSVVTWNGASFDFDILGEAAEDPWTAARLAANHVDLMVAFTCVKGFRMSLKAAATACDTHKGAAGIESGIDAPVLWANGEYERALAYVIQDARATAEVMAYVLAHRGYTWVSKRGYDQTWHLPSGVSDITELTVEKCLNWPKPNTSWMSSPPDRGEFLAWTKEWFGGFDDKI